MKIFTSPNKPWTVVVGLLLLTSAVAYSQPSRAGTYDPAAAFEAGWLSGSNPNGVWSAGYSSTLGGAVTLFTNQVTGADSPNQQMWVAPSVNCCAASPSVGFNNGAAFNDGNVAQAANQILLVSSVFQNLATNLIFTAPSSGTYSLTGSFIGDQNGINVGVDVLVNSSVLFSSNVTSFGQIVPFNGSNITLAAGDTITFAVLQGPGTQNTGLDVSISATPLPSTWGVMLLGLGVLGFLGYRQARGDGVLAAG
jgi:hypothetical protein